MKSMPPTFAFVGQGTLMLCRPGKPPEAIQSAFVQRIEDRAERDRERHGWRADNMAWNFRPQTMALPGMGAAPMMAGRDVRFVSVAAGRDGLLLYSIATSHIGGLFEFDAKNNEERRLVHKANFNAEGLMAHPTTGELTFCVRHADGSSAIGMAQPDGSKHKVVTEGDSVDDAPSWAGGPGRRIVYQSAGIGRNAAGVPIDLTNARIEQLDLDSQSLTVVVEDVRYDYLAPRLTADGTLYAIRRPYESVAPTWSPLGLLKDILLFPFRFLMAVAAFLNVFSMFFRQQPLYGAGGPRMNADMSRMRLWGRWIDTRKAMGRSNKEQALVGSDWKLIRRSADGTETVLADRVVHFDLCDDGGILLTNGSRVTLLAPDGTKTELARGKLIERVAIVRESAADDQSTPVTSR